MAKKKATYGSARIEVIQNKSVIDEMLEQGYPKAQIYQKLVSENKVTVTYTGFNQQVRNLCEKTESIERPGERKRTGNKPNTNDKLRHNNTTDDISDVF